MSCCLCFVTERTCHLPRAVFQLRAASPSAANDLPWDPCRLPTCTNTPWSPSTTRFPHQKTLTVRRATPLCPLPPASGWPAPTSVAWGPSPSWSLPRTGTAPSSSLASSYEGTVQQWEGTEDGSGTKANEDGGWSELPDFELLLYKWSTLLSCRPGSAVVLWREIQLYWRHTRAHKLFIKYK